LNRLVIGSRGSALALWQANWVKEALQERAPEVTTEILIIRTQGDRAVEIPFDQLPGKGFFVKEIEEALLNRTIDLAVHSMKDLPAELPKGLGLGAVTRREDPRDALVTPGGIGLDDLVQGARVGTGSPRRAAQLLARRPDLRMEPVRGNVDTRVRKVMEGDLDAMVLAAAGLNRLGIKAPRVVLEPDVSVPAVGQGAVGIEVRSDDEVALGAVRRLEHPETAAAVAAEREFLAALGGGCQVPIAALATARGERLHIRGLVARPDGTEVIRHEAEGAIVDPVAVGRDLADLCLADGARELLAEGDRPAPEGA